MSWLKGVKNAANTSKYKGYATGGFIPFAKKDASAKAPKGETVTSDPTSIKPVGKAAKPMFGGAGKPFGKACGGASSGGERRLKAQNKKEPL